MSTDVRRPGDEPTTPAETQETRRQLSDLFTDTDTDIFDTDDKTADKTTDTDADADQPFEFDPRHAGLENISAEEAATYIAENKDTRPWLTAVADRHPQVQRVYAALDQGRGHAIPRHDDHGDDTLYERRVSHLEDPAQLDAIKRAAHIDGTKPGDKPHYCGPHATRIHDADAFATAFARGIEHPRVRAALDQYDPDRVPARVLVPIADLLGPNGHEKCSGYQLVGDGPLKARRERDAWLAGEQREGLTAPSTEPVATFAEGAIEFRFRHNRTHDGYEVSTMFPQPPDDPPDKENKP